MAKHQLKIVEPVEQSCGEWECVECDFRRLEQAGECPLLETEAFFPPQGRTKWDKDEEPSTLTADFHLYKLPGFARSIGKAIAEVYRYQQERNEGDAEISIKLKFPLGEVKGEIVIKLPNDIKVTITKTAIIRENGTLRLAIPRQEEMFPK